MYDNDVNLYAGLNDTLFTAFIDVNTQWHRFIEFLPIYETTVYGAKRARKNSAAVTPSLIIRFYLSVRRKL